jgi:hypothetical protein
MTQRKKTMMPIKGYFTRAKVFGWIMAAIVVGYLAYLIYQYFME